ncbi:MAG: DUF1684 domain-containing protein [Chitinophagaceae bacterium]
MRIFLLLFLTVLILQNSQAQKAKPYIDSLLAYQKNYVDSHEVVKGADRKNIRFYPIAKTYQIAAKFEYIANGEWFSMPTSTGKSAVYRKYGKLTFRIHDTTVHLFVYQSQSLMNVEKYKDYLFIPFTDLTTGEGSYDNGRYLEYYIKDIQHNQLVIDFNKAYNPYCAYLPGFSCPLPPQENALQVTIAAGEMKYAKAH